MPVLQLCTSVPHPSWKTDAHKADAGRAGEAPGLLFPRLSRAEVAPSASSMPPSLQLFHWYCSSAHTCLNLAAHCTPCPGTASPSLQCLLHPSCHSPVVRLPVLTRHTAHTSPPCPLGPFPKQQLVPSSLAPEGQADAQRLQQPIPLQVRLSM